MKDKNINYRYFHWGPFLFKTLLDQKELDSIKKLCSKKSKSYNKNLAGLIKHEHMLDVKKIFPILLPYIKSYSKAFSNYSGKNLGQNIELKSCWVNYMTKFESIPKQLKIEYNKCKANTKPGAINFIISLDEGWINQHTFVPEVGDFFIFPADLKHYVNHFKSNGERISISGNLKIT